MGDGWWRGRLSVGSGEGAQPLLALINARRPLTQAVATVALQRYSTVSERGWGPAIDSIGAWRLHDSLPVDQPRHPLKISLSIQWMGWMAQVTLDGRRWMAVQTWHVHDGFSMREGGLANHLLVPTSLSSFAFFAPEILSLR